jgi:HlyD family secretion protein
MKRLWTQLQSKLLPVWQWARQRPLLATPAALLLVFLLVAVARSFMKSGPAQATYFTVVRTNFLISIVEGGTLKAVQEVTVRNELEGSSRIISIVPEGTYVKQDDLLVELDSSDLKERVSQHEVVVQNSQFAFVQAKETLAIQKSLAESNIKDAELRVEFAKSDLERYIEGDRPQAEKNAGTRIAIAEEEWKRSKDRLDWTTELHKKGYATKSELEADTLLVKRNEITWDQAKEDLRLSEKYNWPKEIRRLQANVETAEKELERLKLRTAGNIASYEADLTTRQKTLDLQEQRLKDMKEQLNLTKIFAPSDGLVVYASSSNPNSGILIEEGAAVRQRQDLIKLPDVSEMMVEIRVHESHVQKIKPGQQARVTIDSIPDRTFRGSVRKIAVLPDSSSRYYNPNLKVYATEVVIEDQLPDLKPGISGRAEIIITNLQQVLTVPIQAVTTVKGQQVCFLSRGSSRTPVPVEVGMYNDKFIEIKKGVKEADRVLLAPTADSDNIDLAGTIITAEEATNGLAGDTNAPARAKKAEVKKQPIARRIADKPPKNYSSDKPGGGGGGRSSEKSPSSGRERSRTQ